MGKYRAPFLSTRPNINGYILGEEVLTKVLMDQPRVAITIDFTGKVVGYTERFTLAGGEVVCECAIDESQCPPLDNAYLVGMFQELEWHQQGRSRVIDFARLVEGAITYLPSDTQQGKLKRIKE